MKQALTMLSVLAVVILVGCETRTTDPVIGVDDDDRAMNMAMEKARETMPLFRKSWKTIPNGSASIKIGVAATDGSLEHIWFEPITITDDHVTGICANAPAKVPGLKLGDEKTFDRSEVSDWMILVGNTCYGGYTIRVLTEMDSANAPPFDFADLE